MKAGAFARRSKMNTAAAPVVQEPVVPVMGPEWSIAPEAPTPVSFAGKDMNRRPGLFGRMGNALSRVDWERVFAAMRDDPSYMQDMLSQRESAASRAREDAEAEAERRRGKQTNQQLEALIANEPPEVQAMARLNPQAFIESLIERQSGGDWQVGQGYSHAFRIRPDGRRELGDPLPLRPRAPVQGYGYPSEDGALYFDELPPELQ